MSKEKEIKIDDANANEKVDEQQTEKQAEQAQTDNLSAEDGKEKETEELDPLAKAEQEVESLKKQLLYKTAEFENYRKRTLKEKQTSSSMAVRRLSLPSCLSWTTLNVPSPTRARILKSSRKVYR